MARNNTPQALLKACYWDDGCYEVGCDEAGRGCLAGDLYAAAVILPQQGLPQLHLNDSKQLTARKRNELRVAIEQEALAWAVAVVTVEEIERINILQASILGMHRAIEALQLVPQRILVDGNRFKPYKQIPHFCIVKGDATYQSIAAASILAKTHRDAYMEALDEEYPQYGWKQNKGYPTAAHFKAIEQYGHSPHHRRTFAVHRFQAPSLFSEEEL